MLLKQFYLNCLAHASYLVGDETSGVAAVVDPQRDVDQYLAFAEEHGLRLLVDPPCLLGAVSDSLRLPRVVTHMCPICARSDSGLSTTCGAPVVGNRSVIIAE